MGIGALKVTPAQEIQAVNTSGHNWALAVASFAGAGPSGYDNGTVAYPDAVTEVYTLKLGAATVRTVTLVYTDSTKANLSSFAWV